MDKLILADVREFDKKRGSTTVLYPDVVAALKDLSNRSGMTMTVICNKILRFALPYVEVEDSAEAISFDSDANKG